MKIKEIQDILKINGKVVDALELARQANISYRTIFLYIRDGMPHYSIGNKHFFPLGECIGFISDRRKRTIEKRKKNLAEARRKRFALKDGELVYHLGDVFQVITNNKNGATLRNIVNNAIVTSEKTIYRKRKLIVNEITFE